MTRLASHTYEAAGLLIGAQELHDGDAGHTTVVNPATEEAIGRVPHASPAQLDDACRAAQAAFESWRQRPAIERSRILRTGADLLRSRRDSIARSLTLDQGKPLAEALAEVDASADHLDWHAEESRRIYGRSIPGRHQDGLQLVLREPVGVVAAFTPWNFPLSQATRKVAAALGAGCTLVLKGPENAPSAVWALALALRDAGLPAGCLNLVWGVPAEVSKALIDSPLVRCVSFTGSVPVGRQLASHAGRLLKRSAFELGGHAPVIVFDDADIEATARTLSAMKWRNAGQVCVSPTRFYVHRNVRDEFLERFAAHAGQLVAGDGMAAGTAMGPLAHRQRQQAVEASISDAQAQGASTVFQGRIPDGPGWYVPPTVLADAPEHSTVMREEPFGPVAVVNQWDDLDAVLRSANALPYGLSSYVFTRSARNAHLAASGLQAGQVGINHWGLALPETPMGGVKDSGWGSEGGSESFDPYPVTKFVSHARI